MLDYKQAAGMKLKIFRVTLIVTWTIILNIIDRRQYVSQDKYLTPRDLTAEFSNNLHFVQKGHIYLELSF